VNQLDIFKIAILFNLVALAGSCLYLFLRAKNDLSVFFFLPLLSSIFVFNGGVLLFSSADSPPMIGTVYSSVLGLICFFSVVAGSLFIRSSPTLQDKIGSSLVRSFSRDSYDYRYLWRSFSTRIGDSLDLKVVFQKLSDFIAETMRVRQVVIWLPSTTSPGAFDLAYRLDEPEDPPSVHFDSPAIGQSFEKLTCVSRIVGQGGDSSPSLLSEALDKLGLDCVVPVTSNSALLGFLGVGTKLGGKQSGVEDQHLLETIANQLADLIVKSRLSTELREAREWESFNRVSSFLIHDLKNLATQQSMVLQNAREFGGNADFVRDAFKTFSQTTEKMIHLIANLSVQKNQLITRHEPVNVVELLKNTFDDLKLDQRKGVQLILDVPRKAKQPTVSGDPELLQKAFTNVLLNAVQSLPEGEGTIEVSVQKPNGNVVTAVSDTGQGINSDTLKDLFRPFKTTKKDGTGIGLCHTRTIVESHGGRIHVESRPAKGTKVEIVLPAN
jgi:putative PEP-CTERM system histidine kinase